MNRYNVNPYLPFWETVPDGEPHVFGDRLYVYGSHDVLNGKSFCEGDYVGWSAPIDHLEDWRCEGVIYEKTQDPLNGAPYDKELPSYDTSLDFMGKAHDLYAPDVTRGCDGRYYLYYALDFVNVISVAVSDSPAGPFVFYDYVTKADGSIPNVGRWFDPAVLCENKKVYLYYGFCPKVHFPGMENLPMPGAMMVQLDEDMHTIVTEPVCVANGVDTAAGTDYEEHPFFEASSIRHYGDWYYLLYSSLQGHELCYGMAKSPQGPFAYKGVVISNGDIGYQGNQLPVNYMGNNHGGLVHIKDRYYVFWHRHTHGTAFSRQGCADKIEILEDGTIPQTEVTSCGLEKEPLPAKGTYEAYIACHITGPDRSKVDRVLMEAPGQPLGPLPEEMPYVTEEPWETGERGLKPFVHNLWKDALCGFKYFTFVGTEKSIQVEMRGKGSFYIYLDGADGRLLGKVHSEKDEWNYSTCNFDPVTGTHSIYFKGADGPLDIASFEIKE